ncbi:MAG: hypothetical protein DRQ42_03760 [Gammaproteobacteria bacterium]|nr:MAG: hypothetical protein DRQ42_03760 [Gammaproteobacteria bacterium]
MNDEQQDGLLLRVSDRRSSSRRTGKPKAVTHDDVRKLRKLDEDAEVQLRTNDRRQHDRRTSSPKLLNDDEIMTLRKK